MVNWNLINSNGRKGSSAKIRKSMVSFLTKYHPGSVIDSIEKKYNAYKINLMNGISLVFDADGRYVKSN
ncbi:PepSY-like domain-containing protein [Chryseobacterium sp. KLBC 52]|uniref:PepSY-like domain-containing protein n=1 Tax=Chryseobacterium sp. KLBC 52 TaxID=1862702 RepID=UPI000E0C6B0F|nr:PepSY-like domain-containing protein [Chryseobacterium sp. KLBC 52]